MDPQPERKPAAQAAPKADAKAQPQAQNSRAEARGPSEAYTAMPEFSGKSRRWWPFLLALGLAAGGLGVKLGRHSSAPPLPPPPIQAQAQVLDYSSQDLDAAATQAAKELLAREERTHELAAIDREKAKPVTPRQQAAAALAAMPTAQRADVASGRIGFYTFHLAELVDEGGDVYDISVDGLPILRVTASRELKTITIPIDASKPHTVTQTLVFARPRAIYAKNGVGGPPPEAGGQASLTIRSSAGEVRSHLSSPGQSETWTTQFHGTLASP